MKISNINTYKQKSLSFCKTQVATCHIKTQDDKNEECKIFKLDKKEDQNYFSKLLKNPNWNGSKYLKLINPLMLSPTCGKNLLTYSLESQTGECLGYVCYRETDNNIKEKNINYLETCPEFSSKNKNRRFKYIGEALMAFVIGQSDKDSTDKVHILAPAPSAEKFYTKKCHFKKDKKFAKALILERENYSKFLERHNKKVGSEIRFIA